MASHQDLLDAIARVGAATGNRDSWQAGLSGEEIAAACSLSSSPSALSAVLTKIAAAHPDVFLLPAGLPASPPGLGTGSAADAIRGAETALAQQNSTAAQVDLQVVTAVLGAHVANASGTTALERLQREIESAVLARTDLDTPAGAREFQRFLIGKLRDIRTVVDTAGLDSTSKVSLAAALASLYASAGPLPAEAGPTAESQAQQRLSPLPSEAESFRGNVAELPLSGDAASWRMSDPPLLEFGDIPGEPVPGPLTAPAPIPAPAPLAAPAMTAPPMATPVPGWGGGLPSFGGGGLTAPTLPNLGGSDLLPDRALDDSADQLREVRRERDPDLPDARPDGSQPDGSQPDGSEPEGPGAVHLPDGGIVNAPSAEVAAAMTAALAGTPIVEAFRQQGITLPAPGTTVTAPLAITDVLPGDIGVLADRHALALGNGEVLLDDQIRPIASVNGTGFLGWQHPPVPGPTTEMPEVPAPTGPAETAPS